ncbi:MAG: hypothetical protein QXU40_01190 [Candidatus Pacearchaeota archaeon]
MNKWIEIILGLVILVIGVIIAWASSEYSWTIFGKDLNFLHSAWIFLKGGLFWFVIMISIILIIIGINDLKEGS